MEVSRVNKKERAEYIQNFLAERFPETPIPLDHKDAYTLLIAVLLSAQCTDERVNKITPLLFAKADTPQKMVELDIPTIEAIIKPCGLAPAKAKAIWNLSRILLEKFNGEVPNRIEDLESLPGVGHKTASVVMSQWFQQPAFPVDTHIHRLAQQWELTNGKSVEQTEKDLKRIFPESSWNSLHLRIIFYGREICPARRCDGLSCPLCQTCFPDRVKPRKAKK
jgi:endonuclease-3